MQKLLGECGEVATGVQGAREAVRDVHTTDLLMHFEWLGPFWELNEARPQLTFMFHWYILHAGNLRLNSSIRKSVRTSLFIWFLWML